MHTIGPSILSFVERFSSFRGYFVQSVYTRVHLVYALLGDLSSFGVSFTGGFTVTHSPKMWGGGYLSLWTKTRRLRLGLWS